MAGSIYTWKESQVLEAHVALEDGVGVVLASDSSNFIGKTGLPAAGGKIDFVTVTTAGGEGKPIDVARLGLNDIVQLRAAGTIAYGADVAVDADGKFVAATSTDAVQFKAVQTAEDGSVFSAMRVDAFTKA